MLTAMGDILMWVAQTVQNLIAVIAQILSQMVEGFAQVANQITEEAAGLLAVIPVREALIAASLVLIYLGLKKRLQVRGVILFLFGLGILLVGLGNVVVPNVLPVFLRV